MISLVSLVGRMKAQVELSRDALPMTVDQAMLVVRLLAPHVRDIVRDEIADAHREWMARLERQA